jgi:hypothetical protein
MNLLVQRDRYTVKSTSGILYVDGVEECYTLEDRLRPPTVKVWGETCIPAGTYRLAVKHSPKFGRLMPYLEAVPGFTSIMIHVGNYISDTHGCILVGKGRLPNELRMSVLAYRALWTKLEGAWESGEEVQIEVRDTETDLTYQALSA